MNITKKPAFTGTGLVMLKQNNAEEPYIIINTNQMREARISYKNRNKTAILYEPNGARLEQHADILDLPIEEFAEQVGAKKNWVVLA